MDVDSTTEVQSSEQLAAGAAQITLPCLTIAECTAVADDIRQKLTQPGELFLDLSGCEDIDTAGIQLLTLLRMDDAVSSRVRFSELHEAVQKAAKCLGLSSYLPCLPNPQ
jgi:ABC-type transporter Mla MlaB component